MDRPWGDPALSPVDQSALKGKKMNLLQNAKGQTNSYVPLTGVILVAAIIFGIWYYNNHRNDIVIHPPHIDVH